jgi:thymidylate kinase
MLIIFSGNDGSGKTSFINLLSDKFKEEMVDFLVISEFNFFFLDKIFFFLFKGKERGGFMRRKKNISKKLIPLKNFINSCLYTLTFIDLYLQTFYFKVFKRNKIIIRDRYKIDYLVTLSDLNIDSCFLKFLYQRLPEPSLIFFVDTDFKTCFERRKPINPIDFYRKKEEKYKKLLPNFPNIKILGNFKDSKNANHEIRIILDKILNYKNAKS